MGKVGLVLGALVLGWGMGFAQDLPLTQNLSVNMISPLDPARGVTAPELEGKRHTPVSDEYVWTANSANADAKVIYNFPGVMERTEAHYFRASFNVGTAPKVATLYLAGPRSVKVWINGQMAESVESDVTSPLGMHVFAQDVGKFLHAGRNTIAIEAVRGRGVTGFTNSALLRQLTFGQVVTAKLMAAPQGVDGPVLLRSGKDWKSAGIAANGWEAAGFDDAGWPAVQSIGGMESSIEMLQWNADAGLYDWPGYDGISPFLAHMWLGARKVLSSYAGRSKFDGMDGLVASGAGGPEFSIRYVEDAAGDAPNVVLDFGRELTGRVELVSDTDAPVTVTIAMGESEGELMKDPYLGVNRLTIPPHGTGHGPKTAFRYARVQFLGGAAGARGTELKFKAIQVDHIYYPVTYAGSFESSDELLNRIWEVGAYTAHLCMQDGVWDASKRDRGRWMGDTDVSGRVIEDVFGEKPLMEDTLDRLMGPEPASGGIDEHVNGIPGYSSFWFTGVADFYRHTGDKAFLEREHQRMVELLNFVDREFDQRNVYANKSNVWLYVDWSPELNGDTPETRRATTLEFYRAYKDGAWMLRELGDTANAEKFERRAAEVKTGAEKFLMEGGTFGPRWETNAAAVIGGAAEKKDYGAIWAKVLSQVGNGPGMYGSTGALIISPYYNYYVIRAMAEMGHRAEALKWIETYWGGMLKEGATSFWEAYDPSWYKEDFHSSLQSDNRSGYFVSLAHGWSAGPTAWLMEEVLGINATGAGFSTVDIRPDLVGLEWAKGAEPTPRGLLKVEVKGSSIGVDLPEGVVARVSVAAAREVMVNGAVEASTMSEGGARRIVELKRAGHFELVGR